MAESSFEVAFQGDIATLRLLAKASEKEAELRNELIEFVDNHQPKRLLVDFSDVRFFNSEMVNSLLRTRESIMRFGGAIKLASMSKEIRETFQVLNLEGRIFDIYDTPESALEEWNS